jgi:acetyl esterase/lipase
LDVYAPLVDIDEPLELAPVVVFFAPQIRPFSSRKIIFSSIGANLADIVGAVVVIPDLTNYPKGRIKQQVEDAREVLQWTSANMHRFGGDPGRLYLAGMGIGGIVAQLVPLQAAVVESREQLLAKDSRKTQEDLPNGVREVKVGELACHKVIPIVH